ncbi:hypothetical protein [Vibrio agarivorans]|uniref:hypothetical protein n=1 Tax=Vibrio agarivorans TaxID=153622 RepID=UPI0025B2F644|nr:hypothetical protein [Vibrio agarivorans]MDN3661141.1 hypothetical protein [Vibrio agarivorans]
MFLRLKALRRFSKEVKLSREQKEKMVENLLLLIEEDKAEEKRKSKIQTEADRLREMLANEGISVEQLLAKLAK